MIDAISDALQPVIVEAILTLVLAFIAYLMRFLPAKMQVEIEQRHRDALHSALNTGVGAALDALEAGIRLNPALATADATIGKVLDYTQRSVPDAIRKLGPTPEHLRDMARAKVQEWLVSKGIDPLTAALRDAGAPVPGVYGDRP